MRVKSTTILLGFSLVLAGAFSDASHGLAQTQEDCPLPPGVTPPANPSVTAQQVEDGSASLMDFALAVRDQFSQGTASVEEAFYIGCLVRQEGGPYRSGSTYLVQLTPNRIFVHAKDMALTGRMLNPLIYGAILQALGINPAEVAANPTAALGLFTAAAAGNGGAFSIPNVPGASGYATVYISTNFPVPIVTIAGFDLDESHLAEENFDHANPPITARDVVDRETLKAFVTQAGEFFLEHQTSGDLEDSSKARIALRDPNGPWRHGSVYLYVLDLVSNIILFHAAFPNRFELKPLIATVQDTVTGEFILPQVIEAAKSNPEGGFVEYYFDDPNDDTDRADLPKVGYARQFTGELSFGGRPVPINFIVGSGFYTRSLTPGTLTSFVPVVLSAGGKNNSHFTSELTLTNRGSESALLNFTYTAEQGGGSGSATDMLGPHQQMIASNAIEYLRGLNVPIPENGNRVGTLRMDVSGSSDVSAVVRTTTPTAVPEGRAGLAYPGVPESEGFHDEIVYLCGLRDSQADRSNVAVQNMGSEGSITVRITAFSGDPADLNGKIVWEDTLGPGEFHQVNTVLAGAGKTDPIFGGYVRVERVEGMAPFYAYGVVNDNANSDGSFVFPVSAASLAGAMSQTLPALVESGAFTTELTLTNFSDQPKFVTFTVVDEKIETEDNSASFTVPVAPGEQHIIPNAIQTARLLFQLEVPVGLVVPLIATPVAGDLSGMVIGARVVAQADPEDLTKGQYGVFYTAVPQGMGFTGDAWVDGLQQNEENRSNLALINTGEVDDQDIVFEIDIYDGETATLSKTVTMAEEDKLVVPAKGFKQINQVLKHAPGTTQGYIRIRKTMGTSANPYLAYGVVNDGGAPGERTGDGAYIPARE